MKNQTELSPQLDALREITLPVVKKLTLPIVINPDEEPIIIDTLSEWALARQGASDRYPTSSETSAEEYLRQIITVGRKSPGSLPLVDYLALSQTLNTL